MLIGYRTGRRGRRISASQQGGFRLVKGNRDGGKLWDWIQGPRESVTKRREYGIVGILRPGLSIVDRGCRRCFILVLGRPV